MENTTHPLVAEMISSTANANLGKAIDSSKAFMVSALSEPVDLETDAVLAFGIVMTNNENSIVLPDTFRKFSEEIKAWRENWQSKSMQKERDRINLINL